MTQGEVIDMKPTVSVVRTVHVERDVDEDGSGKLDSLVSFGRPSIFKSLISSSTSSHMGICHQMPSHTLRSSMSSISFVVLGHCRRRMHVGTLYYC
jgi:hypothetical protein